MMDIVIVLLHTLRVSVIIAGATSCTFMGALAILAIHDELRARKNRLQDELAWAEYFFKDINRNMNVGKHSFNSAYTTRTGVVNG